ncbi:tumor necrosis factor receptor superfamily member 11B-like [Branchiostoma floridae]|uniref:Tumor necrosis factor receptor superfamily member 11B-like n=1 Tax=Branchiostoma floridae TaxID=7739 RepID=A0A9J7MBC5_BRAFL|nr:tumor necrosis factor receptor superfamily member 11B-like [Branchiostoma floridae]
MLAAKLCIGISIVIVAVVASLPVSSQATETPDWCPDDSTGTFQLPSGVICNLCPPGTYVTQDCTADNPNPQCENCTATRHYNPCYSYADRCNTCSDCSPILDDGRDGMVDGEECTPTRDRVCTCPSNAYWDFQTASCKAKTLCDEGYGVAHIATYKTDTVCIECVDGTFSDEKSLTQHSF